MTPMSKRRRRKKRWQQVEVMSLNTRPTIRSTDHESRRAIDGNKKISKSLLSLICILICMIINHNPTTSISGNRLLLAEAAPRALSIMSRMASAAAASTTSAPLVKSARLVTYSLTCPPEARIHPCTCLYHTPSPATDDEDEEDVYEIQSITTQRAEPLIISTTPKPTVSSTASHHDQKHDPSATSTTTFTPSSRSNDNSFSTTTAMPSSSSTHAPEPPPASETSPETKPPATISTTTAPPSTTLAAISTTEATKLASSTSGISAETSAETRPVTAEPSAGTSTPSFSTLATTYAETPTPPLTTTTTETPSTSTTSHSNNNAFNPVNNSAYGPATITEINGNDIAMDLVTALPLVSTNTSGSMGSGAEIKNDRANPPISEMIASTWPEASQISIVTAPPVAVNVEPTTTTTGDGSTTIAEQLPISTTLAPTSTTDSSQTITNSAEAFPNATVTRQQTNESTAKLSEMDLVVNVTTTPSTVIMNVTETTSPVFIVSETQTASLPFEQAHGPSTIHQKQPGSGVDSDTVSITMKEDTTTTSTTTTTAMPTSSTTIAATYPELRTTQQTVAPQSSSAHPPMVSVSTGPIQLLESIPSKVTVSPAIESTTGSVSSSPLPLGSSTRSDASNLEPHTYTDTVFHSTITTVSSTLSTTNPSSISAGPLDDTSKPSTLAPALGASSLPPTSSTASLPFNAANSTTVKPDITHMHDVVSHANPSGSTTTTVSHLTGETTSENSMPTTTGTTITTVSQPSSVSTVAISISSNKPSTISSTTPMPPTSAATQTISTTPSTTTTTTAITIERSISAGPTIATSSVAPTSTDTTARPTVSTTNRPQPLGGTGSGSRIGDRPASSGRAINSQPSVGSQRRPNQQQPGRQLLTPNSQRMRQAAGSGHHRAIRSTISATGTTAKHGNHNNLPAGKRRHLTARTRAALGVTGAPVKPTPSPSSQRPLVASNHNSNNNNSSSRRQTRFLAQDAYSMDLESLEQPKPEIVAYCRNIQNPQVLKEAIKGFRGHQVNYFVIDSCKVPPFPNDLFDGIDVRWLEMSNSTVQFHDNFLHPRSYHH